MGRKRSAEYDWICMNCECPCGPMPGKHVGGGQNRRACKGPSRPILRRDWEAMMDADAKAAVEAIRNRMSGRSPSRNDGE